MKLETRRPEPLTILKAAVVYFVLVFGAGFVLGPIRILFLALLFPSISESAIRWRVHLQRHI